MIRKRNFLPSRRSSRSLWSRFSRSVLRETTGNELVFCLQWWKMMSNERRPNTWQFIPPANQTSSMFPLMTIRTGNLPLYSIKSRVNKCIARWGLGEWKGLKKYLNSSLFLRQAALFSHFAFFLLVTVNDFVIELPVRARPNQEMPSVYVEKRQNGERNSQKALHVIFPLQWGRFLRGRLGSFQAPFTPKNISRETEKTGSGKNWLQKYEPFGAKGCTKETLNGTESLAISTPDLV